MIKQLNYNDRKLIDNLDNSPNGIKIKALFQAYGMGRNFVKFYADENGGIVIGTLDGVATLYLKTEENSASAEEFLCLIANVVLTQDRLITSNYKEEQGNIYVCDNFPQVTLEGVSEHLQVGYNVLSQVFPNSINTTTYPSWYTDHSHRVRHSVSKIYTYKDCCSVTAYCNIDGNLLLTQIGTLQKSRGQGIATSLIHHSATNQKNINQIIVLSQNEDSDKFYEKIGFCLFGNWYQYTR